MLVECIAVITEKATIVILNSLITIIIIGAITASIYHFVGIATVVFAAILIEETITFVTIYAIEDSSNNSINQVEIVGYI
jgi:hypothetical protein